MNRKDFRAIPSNYFKGLNFTPCHPTMAEISKHCTKPMGPAFILNKVKSDSILRQRVIFMTELVTN